MKSPPGPYDVSPLRFRLKKAARRAAVALGRFPPRAASSAARGIRVLTYHRFGTSRLDPCCVVPADFEAHLDWLGTQAAVLAPATFDAIMTGHAPAPPHAVLISIDDGHASVAVHALAALDRRGMKALLFVCPGLVGAEGFMGWRDLADAAEAGHVVASHGHSHRSLGRLSLREALREVDEAGAALARQGPAAPYFSFPFGTRADWSAPLVAALRDRGYRYCFSARHGSCRPGAQAAPLPRVKIEGGAELDLFPHIVRGCMDHWGLVDDTFSGLQQRGRM